MSMNSDPVQYNANVSPTTAAAAAAGPAVATEGRPPAYNNSQEQSLLPRIRSLELSVITPHSSTDPPPYSEAIQPENVPPPSYDSLFGRVREAHKSSTGLMDFGKNVLILLLGTIGCTIIIVITIVVPVCMIVFGTIYLFDCPQGEYIPVYLLVGGGFGVLKQLMHLSTRVRETDEAQAAERLRQVPTQQLINCFMLGWFIIGSFWIYREYEPNYDPALGTYCNKTLYLFAFWLITSVYLAMFAVILLGVCAVAIGQAVLRRR